MAKSMRSKSKRRFRAIKRKRSFKKLKEHLLELTKSDNDKVPTEQEENCVEMQSVPKKLPKILCNEHGTYPVWLSKKERKTQIRLKRLQKRNSRSKKLKL
ncbi:unnamed protein product [Trichobilharzia szidati]|nr:unnamed protein product [Trichobilharzia szidati]